MKMFTMVLDLAIHQAYSIYNSTVPNETSMKHSSLRTFKQQVALPLILLGINKCQSAASIIQIPANIANSMADI
jgi:hypothetical protein